MLRFDAASAECFVFTYKEGLLSAVAHDLKLRVTRFSIEVTVEPGRQAVSAEFAADSLRVLHAIRNGREDPGALSDGDRRKIESNIVDEVLAASRYPIVRFTSTAVSEEAGGLRVCGDLSLHGQRRALTVRVQTTGERWQAEAMLSQPDFGIKPYSAMLGALRIRPDVRVVLSLPALPHSP